jgi:hypothetical protein
MVFPRLSLFQQPLKPPEKTAVERRRTLLPQAGVPGTRAVRVVGWEAHPLKVEDRSGSLTTAKRSFLGAPKKRCQAP